MFFNVGTLWKWDVLPIFQENMLPTPSGSQTVELVKWSGYKGRWTWYKNLFLQNLWDQFT